MPERNTLTNVGRLVFVCGIGGLGIVALVTGDVVPGLEPVPQWFSSHTAVAYLTGIAFVVGAFGMVTKRWLTGAAALVAGILLAWLVLLQLPQFVAALRDGDAWTTLLETVALLSVATIVLAGSSPAGTARLWRGPPISTRALQLAFAVALLGFGVLHLIYHSYVAFLVPSWLPWHDFWAYFTGGAFIAAGASMFTKVQARTGSLLTASMFGLWVVMLHSPRVALRLHDKLEWTSLFIAVAMCGGGVLVAQTFLTAQRVLGAERPVQAPVVAR